MLMVSALLYAGGRRDQVGDLELLYEESQGLHYRSVGYRLFDAESGGGDPHGDQCAAACHGLNIDSLRWRIEDGVRSFNGSSL